MKSTTLSTSAWYARYWRWFYSKKEMPGNLCPFFWAVVFALLSTPIVLPTMPWKMKVEGRYPMGLIGWSLFALLVMLVRAFIVNPKRVAIGIAFVIVGAALVVGFGFFLKWIRERWTDAGISRRQKRERIAMGLEQAPEPGLIGLAGQAAKSWYERNCPMLSWNG